MLLETHIDSYRHIDALTLNQRVAGSNPAAPTMVSAGFREWPIPLQIKLSPKYHHMNRFRVPHEGQDWLKFKSVTTNLSESNPDWCLTMVEIAFI